VLAVSDGHGSEKCFRSDIGSQLAIAISLAALREFAEGNPGEIEQQAQHELPHDIVQRWRCAVDAHVAANPIVEAVGQPIDPYRVYGATLVAALVCPSYIVYLQLGDGEILTAARDGSVALPLAADETLIANETTSLCQEEASRNFRVRVQSIAESSPALVLLATDGYPNSFATPEGFQQVASDLLAMLDEDGVEPIAAALPSWLEEASQQGSGDDVSVAILYAPPHENDSQP
jgi:serine/threonine protein phosphatase PrpC